MVLQNVLIIDDDDLSIFLIGMTLADIDFIKSYESVTGGWEALNYLETCNVTNAPDLILVDLNMPEMDGHEFIQRFEDQYRETFSNTRLIVVTSSQRENDKSKSLSFPSVIGFMHKPLTEEKMKAILTNS